MIRTWTVCRQPVPHRDGERRWDQAYQLLFRWAGQDSLPGPALIAQEVPDASGGVCAGADHRQARAQTIEQQLDRLREAVAGRGWELEEQHVYRDDGYRAPGWAARAWTGCGTMRRWPIWTWSWSPRLTGWPATTSTRCC